MGTGDFKITVREILASISIIAVMTLIGFVISGKISDYEMDRNEIYNKAVKIESREMFQYGMETNIGNAFVYGKLKAVDTVSYPELDKEYIYIEKVKEKYTKHTRVVKKGKTSHTETYHTWDEVSREDKKCKEISFLGIKFESNKFKQLPCVEYIDTINESRKIRYKYYGIGTEYQGTILTELCGGTISDNTAFYNNRNIAETVKHLELGTKALVCIFWVLWGILMVGIVYGFYSLENKWLE